MLINSENLVREVDGEIKNLVKKLGFSPMLGVILIGNNPASMTYVEMKKQKALELGISAEIIHFPDTTSKDAIIKKIKSRAQDFHGMMVQLPLPDRSWNADILNAVPAEKDIDCLGDENLGRIMTGNYFITPPTPTSMCMLAQEYTDGFKDKVCTVVGQGVLVGKPLSMMLERKGATVITCNSKTKDLKAETLQGDMVFSGVGRAGIVTGDMIKKDAIVIDAGVSFVDGKLMGDVDIESMPDSARVTPPTNAVGPLTVSLLIKNTAICAERQM